MFNNKYYKQVDGVVMGSPLRPVLADIFTCSFKSRWLRNWPNNLKPVLCKSYLDDISSLFSFLYHAHKFKEYL